MSIRDNYPPGYKEEVEEEENEVEELDEDGIIITGEWDGEPIWREKTAAERLAEIL